MAAHASPRRFEALEVRALRFADADPACDWDADLRRWRHSTQMDPALVNRVAWDPCLTGNCAVLTLIDVTLRR